MSREEYPHLDDLQPWSPVEEPSPLETWPDEPPAVGSKLWKGTLWAALLSVPFWYLFFNALIGE